MYHGIDSQDWLLDAGRQVELPRHGLEGKAVTLLCRDDFDFSCFGKSFDYAIAQSVFTHLPRHAILRCLQHMRRALNPGGQFYATFFEDSHGSHEDVLDHSLARRRCHIL